jgi:hypothetical protein
MDLLSQNVDRASRPGRIKGRSLSLIFLFLVVFLLAASIGAASANSIQFSGLGQVNKTIQIYDINGVADGSNGVVDTINSSGLFYFHPGDSYMFEITPINNTTFLSGPVPLLNFTITSGSVLITIGFILFFCLAVFGVILYVYR